MIWILTLYECHMHWNVLSRANYNNDQKNMKAIIRAESWYGTKVIRKLLKHSFSYQKMLQNYTQLSQKGDKTMLNKLKIWSLI